MAISDEKRREIAANLRRMADEGGSDGVFVHELLSALRVGLPDSGDLEFCNSCDVMRLADLIDVPTTVLDPTETTRTVHCEEVRGWECRECGQSCEEMYGEYEYCPHCGRRVE